MIQTPTFPHLRKAPIREASISFQANLAENWIGMEKIANEALAPFALDGKKHSWEEALTDQSKEVTKVDLGPMDVESYFYREGASPYVIQIEKGAFAMSRLEPYTKWEDIKEPALSNWEKIKNIAGAGPLEAIHVRYVNAFCVPIDGYHLRDVFRSPPMQPEGCSWGISAFFSHALFHSSEEQAWIAISIQRNKPTKPGTANFLLDIIATWERSVDDNRSLDEIFQDLRVAKNKAFHNTLTEKVVNELFL